MMGAGDTLVVGIYTYIPAAVGPRLKPVTCWRDEVRALARLAKANSIAKVERRRMITFDCLW
jgi:hypothetical protein